MGYACPASLKSLKIGSMTFFIGCAIWGYKDWVGELFPPGSRASEFLWLYSRRFPTVEGNTTFYSIPGTEMVQRWATETPEDFQFCLKLPKTVTHEGLLVPQIERAIAFLHQMQPLGSRLGPLFAQLPPSYSPRHWDDLTQFLQAWPHEIAPLGLEVRHIDWFKEPHASKLNAMLTELGVGRVLLDTRPIYDCPDDPKLHSERKKPRVPLERVLTADFSLIRYISHPDLRMNESYLQEWTTQVDEWLRQGKRLYFFVHCPVEERSPANARHFQQLLEAIGAPVPLLPWNQIEMQSFQPSQLSLF